MHFRFSINTLGYYNILWITILLMLIQSGSTFCLEQCATLIPQNNCFICNSDCLKQASIWSVLRFSQVCKNTAECKETPKQTFNPVEIILICLGAVLLLVYLCALYYVCFDNGCSCRCKSQQPEPVSDVISQPIHNPNNPELIPPTVPIKPKTIIISKPSPFRQSYYIQPKWKITTQKINSNNEDPTELCAVCLADNVNCKTLCQHKFHLSCLSEWSKRKINCAVCKRSNLHFIRVWCESCHCHMAQISFRASLHQFYKMDDWKICNKCSDKGLPQNSFEQIIL